MKSIFISSTFRDMQAERDMVQERVLPALREEARKYGDSVGVIDLRWGVDTSTLETEEGAAKVLKVCLDEIDRSHPYMLIFIGERYGWIPESKLIETAVNGREDKYITDDYAKSVTALEIEYGALSEKYGELDRCVICFREPVGSMLDDAEKGIYIEQTEEGRRKLELLKEKIKQDLGDDERLIIYSGTWDKSACQLVNFTSNEQPFEDVLVRCFVKMFQDDWKEYENLSWQEKEQLGFRALMESKLRSFVGREALLEEYYQSAINGNYPIILQGETGSGKTAIMCKLIERLQKEGKNVFAFFAGAGRMSTNAESLVKQMVFYLENLLGTEWHFNESGAQYNDWIKRLRELTFGIREDEKIYLCIDAMDQLFFDEHVEKLDFLIGGIGTQFIVSCTDTFNLPSEMMLPREIKKIPVLREEDARTVAEGILASYSRNAYAAIENEILKKKSVGNPLYISLLIQRLNMMDMEELRTALTEEEIVTLGRGIIINMPEETKVAIVSVIKDGIYKISEVEGTLFEAIQYLAVSRNGLRMSDLQGIFMAQGKSMPTLDFTLLVKYLDGFFYVHDDDRIDFTHKVIRQGLLEELIDRDSKEENIKEYLKTLSSFDGLYMREAMYFARIRNDLEFAEKLIGQAYKTKTDEFVKAIKNETVADGGEFYCRLLEKGLGIESVVRDFFLMELLDRLGLEKEEMRAKLAVENKLVVWIENLHEECNNDTTLFGLMFYYNILGSAWKSCGRMKEAQLYLEKALKSAESLYERIKSEEVLKNLAVCYYDMGNVLRDSGQEQDALSYFEKSLKCREDLHYNLKNETSLKFLLSGYSGLGLTLNALGKNQEALSYFEKALKYREILHKRLGTNASLRALVTCYDNMGNALANLGQMSEALQYYEKALMHFENLYRESGSEASLKGLSISYERVGSTMESLGRRQEALSYYEKSLKCAETLHEKVESAASLRELFVCCNSMGGILERLERAQEALSYLQKSIQYREDLYNRERHGESLRELAIGYNSMGNCLRTMGRAKEALVYYEKSLKCREDIYNRSGSEASLGELAISYNSMGHGLKDLGRLQEALLYYEKDIACAEKLYEKLKSEARLQDLVISYNCMGNALKMLGKEQEAQVYYDKAMECKKNQG